MLTPEVNGYKRDPYNAGSVHSKSNELGLVEVLGYVARFYGIQGAKSDEQGVEGQRREHGSWRGGTGQYGTVTSRVLDYRHRGLHHQHRRGHGYLDRYQYAGYHDLKVEK